MPNLALAPPPILPPPPPPPEQRSYENVRLRLERGDETIDLPMTGREPNHVWCVGEGVEGLDIPELDLQERRAAGMFGSFAMGLDSPAREVFLPLQVKRPTLTLLLQERDRFNRITRPYQGETVRIVATRPDNTERWIDGFRVGPTPRWDRSNFVQQIAWQRFGATFRCPDMWWKSAPYSYSWVLRPGRSFFPITPIHLSPRSISGTPITVQNIGDVISYPLFTLIGPLTGVTATHVNTGRSWVLDYELNPGETMYVDADPRAGATAPPVRSSGGTSRWQYMTPPVDLWPLPPGEQRIAVTATGGTEGQTEIRMTVRPQWETV